MRAAKVTKLTQRQLKRLIKYDPITGIFTWRKAKGNRPAGAIIDSKSKKDGYIRVNLFYKTHVVHRLAFLYMLGYNPENNIDHINRKPDDNRWENLREVTQSCNLRNCNHSTKNKTGIKGICFSKNANKWLAQIGEKYLGIFPTLKEAAQARYNAEVELGYPDCDINSTAKQYLDSLK